MSPSEWKPNSERPLRRQHPPSEGASHSSDEVSRHAPGQGGDARPPQLPNVLRHSLGLTCSARLKLWRKLTGLWNPLCSATAFPVDHGVPEVELDVPLLHPGDFVGEVEARRSLASTLDAVLCRAK